MNQVRSEIAKLTSLRSIWAALGGYVVLSIGLGAMFGAGGRQALDSNNAMLREDFTPELAGFESIGIGMLSVVVLGVLAATVEYGSGMQRLSLLAQPNRGRFLAGKLAGITVLIAPIALVTVITGYWLAQKALGPYGSTLTAPSVPRAIAGAVVAVTLMAVLSFGLAVVTRSTVAPLAIILPMIFAGSQILSAIPATRELARFLPDKAAGQLYRVQPTADELGPAWGLVVLTLWTLSMLAAAAYMTLRRPA